MTITNSIANLSTLFFGLVLAGTFYFIDSKRKQGSEKILLIGFITYLSKCIFGFVFSLHYITSDTINFYNIATKAINTGYFESFEFNYFLKLHYYLYLFFGEDLSSLRAFLCFFSTLTSALVFLFLTRIITDNKYKKETLFASFFFPPTFFLGFLLFKENFLSNFYILYALIIFFYKDSKFLVLYVLPIFIIAYFFRPIFIIIPSVLFIIYYAFKATQNRKITRVVVFSTLFLIGGFHFATTSKKWGLNSFKNYVHQYKENKKSLMLKPYGGSSTKSSFSNFQLSFLEANILIYPAAIARSLYSPSPIKPIRDVTLGYDEVNLLWFLDCLINGVYWLALFPFFIKSSIYGVVHKDSFLILGSLTFIQWHCISALNDVLWVPQYVRYRLAALPLFFLLAIYGRFLKDYPQWRKYKKVIWLCWIGSVCIANLLYLFFTNPDNFA